MYFSIYFRIYASTCTYIYRCTYKHGLGSRVPSWESQRRRIQRYWVPCWSLVYAKPRSKVKTGGAYAWKYPCRLFEVRNGLHGCQTSPGQALMELFFAQEIVLCRTMPAHVSHNLNSSMRSFKGLYRELLQGLLRRLRGVQTMAHVTLSYVTGRSDFVPNPILGLQNPSGKQQAPGENARDRNWISS